jgi:hypothetical protein
MVNGQRTPQQALKFLRKAAKVKGYTVAQPRKDGGKSVGKGSHEAWAIYDKDDKEIARCLVPGHRGDMSHTVTESIEGAFEEYLGKGWMDK